MEQNNYIEIDLFQIARIFKKKLWLICLFILLGAAAALSIARFLIVPQYESLAKIYVNNIGNINTKINQSYTNSDLQAAQSLVETYMVIMKSRPTLEAVIKNEKLPYTYEELKALVSGKAENETEIFSVTVTSPNPAEAVKIVNGIVDVLPAQIAEIVEGASVRIVERGILNAQPVSPKYKTYALVGSVIGLLVIVFILVIRSLTDTKIHDESFAERLPGEKPLLAAIPELNPKNPHKSFGYGYKYYRYSKKAMETERENQVVFQNTAGDGNILCSSMRFSAAEAYKLLRTNVLYSLPNGEGCIVVGATSCTRAEGKSTTCINLAYTFAETGKRVLLIEGDMRLPNIAKRLNLRPEPGLSNVAGGFSKVTEVIQQTTVLKNFYAITAGKIPPNPTELLSSKHMANMMTVLRKHFDYIILDIPPVNLVSDALTVSPYLDGMLVIAREDFSDLPSVNAAVQKLIFADIKILGYVLTRSSAASKIAYHQYEHGGYASGYSNRPQKSKPLQKLPDFVARKEYSTPYKTKTVKIGKPNVIKKTVKGSGEKTKDGDHKGNSRADSNRQVDLDFQNKEQSDWDSVSKTLEEWVLSHEEKH